MTAMIFIDDEAKIIVFLLTNNPVCLTFSPVLFLPHSVLICRV